MQEFCPPKNKHRKPQMQLENLSSRIDMQTHAGRHPNGNFNASTNSNPTI